MVHQTIAQWKRDSKVSRPSKAALTLLLALVVTAMSLWSAPPLAAQSPPDQVSNYHTKGTVE